MPDGFNDEEKRLWNNAVEILSQMQVLTVADGFALSQYVIALAKFWDAKRIIDTEGQTYIDDEGAPKEHPAVSIAQRWTSVCKNLEDRFGLTPAARTRIHVGSNQKPPQGKDNSRFFGGNKQKMA